MAGNTGQAGTTVASRVLALPCAFDEGHRALGRSELASLGRNRARLVSALQVAARGIGRSVAAANFRWTESEGGAERAGRR